MRGALWHWACVNQDSMMYLLRTIESWKESIIDGVNQLRASRLKIVTLFIPFYDFVSGDFANWNLQQFIVDNKVRRCKIYDIPIPVTVTQAWLSNVILLDTSQKIDLVHHKSHTRYDTTHSNKDWFMHEWPENNVRKKLLIIHIHIINYVIKTNFPVSLAFSNQAFCPSFIRAKNKRACV